MALRLLILTVHYVPSMQVSVSDDNSRPAGGYWWLLSLAIAATLAIGVVDLATGRDLGFFVFYFAPVGFAGWRLGLKSGVALAVISALVWAIADALPGHWYPHPTLPVWNAIIRLTAFLVIGIGSNSLRVAYETQQRISRDLYRASSQVRTLEALLPICASCKKIRDDQGHWEVLERYIGDHAGVKFSHGICPECAQQMIREAGLPDDFLKDRDKTRK